MLKNRVVAEGDLAALAKQFRMQANKSRAEAAREMEVSQTSIFHAEEHPALSLLKLRARMIEAYSPYRLEGAFFLLRRKKPTPRRKGDALRKNTAKP